MDNTIIKTNNNIDISLKNNITTSHIETCDCGNKIWTQGIILKKISKLISQSGTEEVMPIPIFICSKCGEPAPMFKNDPKFNDIMCDNN